MKKLILLIIVAIVAAMSACSDDDSNPQPNPAEYTSAEAYLEEIGFSGSVSIRKGGADLVRKGFGMADIASGTSNEPSLIYRIGSVTKSFTSAAIINLKRDGLIESFDQPLSDFDDEDQVTYHHGGNIDGFTSFLAFIPESNGLIILLSNEQDKDEQRNQILETIMKNEF